MITFSAELHERRTGSWRRVGPGSWRLGQSTVVVVPSPGYHLLEGDDYLVVHDGRVATWEHDPLRFNGSFLGIRFLAAPSYGIRLLLDRLGTVPVYWATRGGVIWTSSRLEPFARAGFDQPDWSACWEGLFYGAPLWERTYLVGVYLAPPAATLEILPTQPPTAEPYWQPPAPQESSRNEAGYLDELIGRMRISHSRCIGMGAQLALPVTGGLDSRINLALQREDWPRVHLFTAFARGELEAPIVGRIAQVVGRPLLTVQRLEGLLSIFDTNVWTESGELSFRQRFLEDTVVRVASVWPSALLMDGYMQDALFNPHVVRADARPLQQGVELARFHYRSMGRNPEDSLIRNVLARFEAEYNLSGSSSPLAASQRHYLHNRSRRLVFGTVRVAQNHLPVALPGLDSDVLDFGFALPWRMRVGGPLYRNAIATLAPELASLPYDKTGRPILAQGEKSWRIRKRDELMYYLDKLWPNRWCLQGSEVDLGNVVRKYPAFRKRLVGELRASRWVAEMLGGASEAPKLVARLQVGAQLGHVTLGLLTLAKLEEAIHGIRRE